MHISFRAIWLPLVMFALYAAAIAFRPLLPIDETRYMSVAWEMALRQGWLQPLTMNFEPYHHKPPMLFWLINTAWSVFGISRWAGLIPVVISAGATVFLTGILGRLLLPGALHDQQRTMLVMVGTVPFIIYSTLVLFDLTVTVFVLLALVCTVKFARDGRWPWMLMAGLCIGLGVLTKGPVAYLYVIFPLLLGPLWRESIMHAKKWYSGAALALLVSVLPVLFWLVPMLRQADGDFAFWILWGQTAGRITGSFGDSHARSILFYLPLLPVMIMPWLFFPSFWRGIAGLDCSPWSEGTRFLFWWLLPTFVCFCLISGKQPHYLVPLLPGAVLILSLCLQQLSMKTITRTVALMVAIVISGQAIASKTAFKAYDLQPIADIVRQNPDADWAYVRNYHAEVGFLGGVTKPVTDIQIEELADWFAAHPQGLAIVRYRDNQDMATYEALIDVPYRGKRLGVFRVEKEDPAIEDEAS